MFPCPQLLPLLVALICPLALTCQAGRVVAVDPGSEDAYATLSEAAAELKPGDTLWIAPGSGPYREALRIHVSGTVDKPIMIEGNGNEITGFDPLTFHDGQATPPVAYPFVLRFEGKRVRETAAGEFEFGVYFDLEASLLILKPGTPESGWEISTRDSVVALKDVSHHHYRELIATGSRNDGFNLHGSGEGLIFEQITGSHNLDEGFSAHGTIQCEIRGGLFFQNDNGLLNTDRTSIRIENADVYKNLGIGLGFSAQARVEMINVRTWENGIVQLLLRSDVQATCRQLHVYDNPHKTKPWLTYKESVRRLTPETWDFSPDFTWQSGQPTFHVSTAP